MVLGCPRHDRSRYQLITFSLERRARQSHTPRRVSTPQKGPAMHRAAMPDGLAVQTHVVAENDRVASISVWDGTVAASGQSVDFTSADFLRIENGVAAEHWDTVDYVRLYQAFGLLPASVWSLPELTPSRDRTDDIWHARCC